MGPGDTRPIRLSGSNKSFMQNRDTLGLSTPLLQVSMVKRLQPGGHGLPEKGTGTLLKDMVLNPRRALVVRVPRGHLGADPHGWSTLCVQKAEMEELLGARPGWTQLLGPGASTGRQDITAGGRVEVEREAAAVPGPRP